MLDKLKLMLGITDNTKDTLLNLILDIVIQEFLDYTNRDDIPDGANAVALQMAVIQYNRIGSQGLASQGYSGVSESYIDGYPENIRKQLNRYRKMKAI